MEQFFEDVVERFNDLHNEVKQTIQNLPETALDWSPGPDFNPINILVAHIAGSEAFWIGEFLGELPANRNRDTEFQVTGLDHKSIDELLDRSLAVVREALEELPVDALATERLSAGHGRNFSLGWALAHGLEHTAQHVGHIQLTAQLWEAKHG